MVGGTHNRAQSDALDELNLLVNLQIVIFSFIGSASVNPPFLGHFAPTWADLGPTWVKKIEKKQWGPKLRF